TISEVAVSPQSCDGGLYYVLLDFVYEGNSKDYFIVKKNGESLGQYKYDDLPVELGPFWSVDSSVQVLQLFDAENDDCRMEVEYMDPDCGSCSLEGLDVKVGECTSDSTYQVALDYNGTNPIDLYVNGQFFGSYDTVQLPVILDDFPASGLVFDHIKVCSLDSNYCCRDLELESPACVRNLCAFEDVRYELTDCDSNGNFHVVLSLDTIGRQEGTFVVKYGDARSEFSYESLPVKVGPYPAGETFYQFTVFDSEHPDCSALLNVGRVICPDRCDLAFGRIDIVECGDENLVILVDSLEGSFDAFDVYFADQYLGFHHAEELPLRLKAYHPTSPEATIRICVSDNTTCCFERVLSIDDCPGSTSCQIGALTFDTLECRNDSFYVNLNFSEQPLDSNSYELKVNGDLVRSFSASELPLHIGPFLSGADKRYSFVVKSGQAESCQSELVLEDVVCPASSIVEGTHMLILESGHFTNYLKVPEFVTQRSIFQLIDLSGRVLYEIDFSIETDRAVLPLPMDAAGMYLVRISSKEGQQLTTKIIIP
ncbi:MAG: T9SS type A sorting domain-containing protein, partial [Saprospiraceae bacterium]|nr:T9SS type A sorting domain-containing protein [Saprospiraceae bacterium]